MNRISPMKIYTFRNCVLNAFERSVFKDGVHVALTPKTFDVLQLLVERSGEIVSKDEILNMVWRGNLVEESNLAVHIAKLRRSLGEPHAGRIIETVHGIGYRFVAPIRSENIEDSSSKSEHAAPFKNSITRSELEKAISIFTEAAETMRRLLP